jgi:hypothetical protein
MGSSPGIASTVWGISEPLEGGVGVATGAGLGGNGTAGSPLAVSGWPLKYFGTSLRASGALLGAANQVSVSGLIIPFSLTFSKLQVGIATTDSSNNYDVGIYSQAGVLLANAGAQTLPTANDVVLPMLQGSQTLPPGLYLFGWTGNANTASLYAYNGWPTWFFNNDVASSSGGALPASIGAQTITPNSTAWYVHLF